LIESYKLSDRQSSAILEMRLSKLTAMERDKLLNDYNDPSEPGPRAPMFREGEAAPGARRIAKLPELRYF